MFRSLSLLYYCIIHRMNRIKTKMNVRVKENDTFLYSSDNMLKLIVCAPLQDQLHAMRSTSAPPYFPRPIARITVPLSAEEVAERARLRLHLAGGCTACSYFALKPDGCRLGKDCPRCHWCTEEEARKQQKKKRIASKARARLYAMNGMRR